MFNDNIPSYEVDELGCATVTQSTPISNNVKTSQSFFNFTTGVFVGDGVKVGVGVEVNGIVGVGVDVLVGVGVDVLVGVGVGVGQVIETGVNNFVTPL